MNFVTSTDLRKKTSQLIKALKQGQNVSLVHRSKIIGKIEPVKENPVFNLNRFKKIIKKIGPLEELTYKERENTYRKHLEEKYGKSVITF